MCVRALRVIKSRSVVWKNNLHFYYTLVHYCIKFKSTSSLSVGHSSQQWAASLQEWEFRFIAEGSRSATAKSKLCSVQKQTQYKYRAPAEATYSFYTPSVTPTQSQQQETPGCRVGAADPNKTNFHKVTKAAISRLVGLHILKAFTLIKQRLMTELCLNKRHLWFGNVVMSQVLIVFG